MNNSYKVYASKDDVAESVAEVLRFSEQALETKANKNEICWMYE